jgi:putative endopeptidase
MNTSVTKNWGFDPRNIDKSIRPQDDFYLYANGGWIKKNTIPPDESRWGSFTMLRFRTEHQLKSIVDGIVGKDLKRTKGTEGSPAQLVGDMYRSALDMKRRNALGIKPIAELRKNVRDISDRASLMHVMTQLHRLGINVPWEFFLDQDAKDSSRYLLTFTQDGIGLPEREYYLSNAPEQKRVRDAYIKHIQKILQLGGMTRSDAAKAMKVVMKIETQLAQASMKKEDMRDAEKTYHKRTLKELQKEVPQIDWARYCKALGAGAPRDVNLSQPEFFKAVGRMISDVSLEDWKTYLDWHVVNESAPLLSEPFVNQTFNFYGKVLTGSKKMRAPWRRALGSVGIVGEALGKLYVERYFTKAAKRRMDILVDDLFIAYASRIKNLPWMSPATKKKALVKLRAMNRKIGYPSKFEKYNSLIIKPDDYFGNIIRAHEFGHNKVMRRLGKPVDRKVWFMTPQTVNAYCHFNLNEIVFPAAILQAPFFSVEADDAVNYGAIGSVIGHEITHGFDDQGSKFDAKGNMRSWWSAKDKTQFEKRAKVLINQYNQFMVADGVKANGQLTLGENIADLGGVSIAFDAFQTHLKRRAPKDVNKIIDGFTPEQRFFLGFAQSEQEVSRPEMRKMQALTDPHSIAPHRVNGPLPNIEAFYAAFDLTKQDKLFRSPASRAQIW